MTDHNFAPEFFPTIKASFAGNLLVDSPDERRVLEVLLKSSPFSKYIKIEKRETEPLIPVNEIREKDKQLIKDETKKQLSSGSTSFNDQLVINIVNQKVTSELLNSLDDGSDETKLIRFGDLSHLPGQPPTVKAAQVNEHPKTAEEKKELLNDLRSYQSSLISTIYMERGIQLEERIVAELNKKENYNFVKEDAIMYLDMGLFMISAVPDGVDWDRQTVVEIKTKRYMGPTNPTIWAQERAQCFFYMKVTDCKVCLLVKNGPKGEQDIHRIEWDDDEFKGIVDKLNEFVMKYRQISEVAFTQMLDKYSYNEIYPYYRC